VIVVVIETEVAVEVDVVVK
jgi:hypothetical protein